MDMGHERMGIANDAANISLLDAARRCDSPRMYCCRQSIFALLFLMVGGMLGACVSLSSPLTPELDTASFVNLSRNDRISNESQVLLPPIAPQGSFAVLKFAPWPHDSIPATPLTVTVCGEIAVRALVDGKDPVVVPLNNRCSPLSLGFSIGDPNSSVRYVAPTIRSVTASSRLGVALPSVERLFRILLPLLLVWLCIFRRSGRTTFATSIFVSGVVAAAAASFALRRWANLEALLWCGALLGVGLELGRRMRPLALQEKEPVSRWADALAVLVIVVIALCLRLWGIDFGIPAWFHPDEEVKARAVAHMLETGDLNPHYFKHPSLLLYLSGALAWVSTPFMPEAPPEQLVRLCGRIVSALSGSLSCAVVYYIGRVLGGRWIGFGAGLLLAVNPLHVTCSRYMKEDALLVFWILLVVLFSLRASSRGVRQLWFAASCVGFATGSKYTGALSALIPAYAVVALLSPEERRRALHPRHILGFIAVALGSFLLTTPYSLLDLPGFLEGVRHERQHLIEGHVVPISPWSEGWMYHFLRSVLPTFGVFGAVCAILSAGILFVRGNRKELLIVLGSLLFYLSAEVVNSKPYPFEARYIAPMVPFLCLMVMRVLGESGIGRKTSVCFLTIALGLFLEAAWSTTRYTEGVVDDTRVEMAKWMRENLPSGASVVVAMREYSIFDQDLHFALVDRRQFFAEPEVLKNAGPHYILLSSFAYGRYEEQPGFRRADKERVAHLYNSLREVKSVQVAGPTLGFHSPSLRLMTQP